MLDKSIPPYRARGWGGRGGGGGESSRYITGEKDAIGGAPLDVMMGAPLGILDMSGTAYSRDVIVSGTEKLNLN